MSKYLMVVPDGAGDYPLKELGGRTPLEVADIPNMDFIARKGISGTAVTIPSGLTPGSDVANLSLLGYDPARYYTGRGPIEAASMGVQLREGEYAFRCNLVTVNEDTLLDYSAGHISSQEAEILIRDVQGALGGPGIAFYPGVSYRHLLVLEGDFAEVDCYPPHDVVGMPLRDILPRGKRSSLLLELMVRSREILEAHPVNISRKKRGAPPANSIWPWGQGRSPQLPSLRDKYGIKGAVITAVDLIKGLGKCAGMEVLEVAGATGYFDTDYAAKAAYALAGLDHNDLIFIHIEAPDEAGHQGDIKRKIEAIEEIDRKIVGTILEEMHRKSEDFHILVAPDHLTPITVRTHVAEPVPVALYHPRIRADASTSFSEKEARKGSLRDYPGPNLMDLLLNP